MVGFFHAPTPHSRSLPIPAPSMPRRMDDPTPTRSQPLATVKTVGWVVGALLAGALIAILLVDHKVHVADVGSDSLVPWWMAVGWGLLFYVLYWVGFRYLLRTLRRHGNPPTG